MPRPRKPANTRQNRATKDLGKSKPGVGLAPNGVSKAPSAMPFEADPKWLMATREDWLALWKSELSSEITVTDYPALLRLFGWRDEQRRCRKRASHCRKEAEKNPFIEGSKGQPVLNPMFDIASKDESMAIAIEAKVVALEDRLAMSPKARLNIGVTQQRGVSLTAQNQALAWAISEGIKNGAKKDPRSAG